MRINQKLSTLKNTIYTIGHSNHEMDKFIALLKQHNIEVVADVRSAPYSKYSPQFNKDTLKTALLNHGIKYLFLGAELGARPNDQSCYVDGRVSFSKLRNTDVFQEGVQRLLKGMTDFAVSLMCSEKDPVNCHRTILVSRALAEKGVAVQHILENGSLVDQAEIERQLMRQFDIQPDLFETNRDLLVREAYRRQEEQITYKPNETEGRDSHE